MSLNYHKRIDFRALDVFVDAVKNASREDLERAVKTASEMSKDMIISASDRPIWKRLATLLRAELKGYKKNPVRKKTSKKKSIRDKWPAVTTAQIERLSYIGAYAPVEKKHGDTTLVRFGYITIDDDGSVYPAYDSQGRVKYYGPQGQFIPKTRRAKNPRKNNSNKGINYYQIFRGTKSGKISFFRLEPYNVSKFGDRSKALLFRGTKDPLKIAEMLQNNSNNYIFGVVSNKEPMAEIKKVITGKT